ncbi:hypothetical protein AAP_01999 [Ascosphaera apis ARSEF 7405]|uniref:Uncharacterized protein n=1 Tax=Ascosphaera apis ARSEF 7405 TaxID=392613 RepID=A0A168AGP9_9EURO|nr:hypothetical protein AAP_01999 [Ascosphaera apis ARSEF 7405]
MSGLQESCHSQVDMPCIHTILCWKTVMIPLSQLELLAHVARVEAPEEQTVIDLDDRPMFLLNVRGWLSIDNHDVQKPSDARTIGELDAAI